jgi:hypothetical protein
MSDPENILQRWSRKKREASEGSRPREQQNIEPTTEGPAVPPADAENTGFDLDQLPSLESITAQTDIRDFLRTGVPADLRREALRRAWSADPGIRDFIGLAENSGDFNDPTAMPGFGPIQPSEVARLMAQFVLSPREEKMVPVPEMLTDQGDGSGGEGLSADSASAADGSAPEAKSDVHCDVASQNRERKDGITDPSTARPDPES